MPLRLQLEVFGDVQLDRELLRFSGRVTDLRPVWEALAADFEAIEAGQFNSQGARGSGGWQPLAESTVRQKARHPEWDQRILHRTLALRNSLTDAGAPGAVRQIAPAEMLVGSTVAYGVFHQQGKGVPRRRPVELTAADRRRWVKAVQQYVVTGRTSAGAKT